MRIWKYTIPCADSAIVTMPSGARLLSVHTQHGAPQLWALCDPAAPITRRHLIIHGTGHPAEDCKHLPFIGTFMLDGGSLVFHLFDGGELP